MKGIKRNKKHASSDKEQGEICFSYWCLPPDFFLDLSLVFCQLQVLLVHVEASSAHVASKLHTAKILLAIHFVLCKIR